jgi:hypothetical protein
MRKRSCLEIIGERETIAVVATGEDVWRGSASTIPIPDQINGEQMTLVSTSVNDASAGTGIRTISVHYLDTNFDEQEETVIMTGTTGVNTVATDIKFVQDIHATTVGSGGVAAGVITLHLTGTPATVFDVIDIGGNMSLTMTKMVPAGFNFYLSNWTASVAGNKPTFVRLRSTDHHGTLYDGGSPVFIFKDTAVLETAPFGREWPREERILMPEKSIIKATVWTTQAGGDVAVSLVGELIGTS